MLAAADSSPAVYTDACPRCKGSGRFHFASSYGTVCLKCGGSGRLVFKNSAADRAAARAQAARRRERKAEAWAKENPDAYAWIVTNMNRNGFAASLDTKLAHYGFLTPGQLGAVQRAIAKDAERKVAAAPVIEKPRLELPKVEDAFTKARAAGIKYPRLRLGEFTLQPASENAKPENAGAIYVKSGEGGYGGVYLGKVLGGQFSRSRDCSGELEARIVEACSDPLAAAIAYGKKYGACAVCGRELSNKESVERGIGPICAERFGW